MHAFFDLYPDVFQMGVMKEIVHHVYNVFIDKISTCSIDQHVAVFRNFLQFSFYNWFIQE